MRMRGDGRAATQVHEPGGLQRLAVAGAVPRPQPKVPTPLTTMPEGTATGDPPERPATPLFWRTECVSRFWLEVRGFWSAARVMAAARGGGAAFPGALP